MGALEPALVARLRARSTAPLPAAAAAALAAAVVTAALVTAGPPAAGLWTVLGGWAISCALAAAVGARWASSRCAARVRRDFAAGMSHDLRTPLAQIQMFTEMLLLGRDRTPEERTAWLEVIERESHTLGSLVDNLLVLAHGPDAAPFPARETLDLGLLVEDVAATYAGRAAARRMSIVADPPPGILVAGDPRAIRQSVANLLDNALRFGPEGQRVVLAVRAEGGRAELCVEDQGPGLPPEESAVLLGSRGYLERPLRPNGGRGLGLAVVARVVQAHGGRASADRKAGGGARVRVALPLASTALVPPGGG